MKYHRTHGIEGLVLRVRCRATGLEMGLYHSYQSGFESDPETPWSAVCETHGSIVCTRTQRQARTAMSYPDWCEDCQGLLE